MKFAKWGEESAGFYFERGLPVVWRPEPVSVLVSLVFIEFSALSQNLLWVFKRIFGDKQTNVSVLTVEEETSKVFGKTSEMDVFHLSSGNLWEWTKNWRKFNQTGFCFFPRADEKFEPKFKKQTRLFVISLFLVVIMVFSKFTTLSTNVHVLTFVFTNKHQETPQPKIIYGKIKKVKE